MIKFNDISAYLIIGLLVVLSSLVQPLEYNQVGGQNVDNTLATAYKKPRLISSYVKGQTVATSTSLQEQLQQQQQQLAQVIAQQQQLAQVIAQQANSQTTEQGQKVEPVAIQSVPTSYLYYILLGIGGLLLLGLLGGIVYYFMSGSRAPTTASV